MAIFEYWVHNHSHVEARVVDEVGNVLAGPEVGFSNGEIDAQTMLSELTMQWQALGITLQRKMESNDGTAAGEYSYGD